MQERLRLHHTKAVAPHAGTLRLAPKEGFKTVTARLTARAAVIP